MPESGLCTLSHWRFFCLVSFKKNKYLDLTLFFIRCLQVGSSLALKGTLMLLPSQVGSRGDGATSGPAPSAAWREVLVPREGRRLGKNWGAMTSIGHR